MSLNPLPRSDRPRKLTPKQRWHLDQLVSANKYSTSTELANILNAHHVNLNVSNRTMLNELHNMQYHEYHTTIPKSIPSNSDNYSLSVVAIIDSVVGILFIEIE